MTTILESVRAFMAEEFKGGAANISDLISACQEAESRKDLASIVEDINNQKLKEDATTLLRNGFDEGVEPELISLKLMKLLEEHEGSRNDANLTDINQQRAARSKKLESYERNLLGEYYDSGWQEVDSKPVKDWDDFWTDYTWYVDATDHHVFIFGDKDIYGPDDTPDHEVDGNYAEAEEWFLTYEGPNGDEDDYEECFSLGKVAEAMAWEDDDYDDDDDWGTPRLSSSTPTGRAGEWSTLRYKSSEDLDEGAEGKQRKGYKWIIYQDEEPYKIVAVRSTHTEAQAYILKHLDKDLTCDEVEEKYAIKGRNYDQDLFEESFGYEEANAKLAGKKVTVNGNPGTISEVSGLIVGEPYMVWVAFDDGSEEEVDVDNITFEESYKRRKEDILKDIEWFEKIIENPNGPQAKNQMLNIGPGVDVVKNAQSHIRALKLALDAGDFRESLSEGIATQADWIKSFEDCKSLEDFESLSDRLDALRTIPKTELKPIIKAQNEARKRLNKNESLKESYSSGIEALFNDSGNRWQYPIAKITSGTEVQGEYGTQTFGDGVPVMKYWSRGDTQGVSLTLKAGDYFIVEVDNEDDDYLINGFWVPYNKGWVFLEDDQLYEDEYEIVKSPYNESLNEGAVKYGTARNPKIVSKEEVRDMMDSGYEVGHIKDAVTWDIVDKYITDNFGNNVTVCSYANNTSQTEPSDLFVLFKESLNEDTGYFGLVDKFMNSELVDVTKASSKEEAEKYFGRFSTLDDTLYVREISERQYNKFNDRASTYNESLNKKITSKSDWVKAFNECASMSDFGLLTENFSNVKAVPTKAFKEVVAARNVAFKRLKKNESLNEWAGGEVYTVFAKRDDMTFIMHNEGNRLSVTGWYFGEPNSEDTQIYDGDLTAKWLDVEHASVKVYTVYAKNDDMTFIMHDEEDKLSVTGWYFGEPDAEATQIYDGDLVAEWPDDNSYN